MTIVFYDPSTDVIGVDQLVSVSSGSADYLCSKVARDVGGAVALSGFILPVEHVSAIALDEFEKIAEGVDKGEKAPQFVDCGVYPYANDVNVNGFGRAATGEVYYVCLSNGRVTLIRVGSRGTEPAMAEGSGYEWFNAYVAIGHTPLEAARLVAANHKHCGGEIEVF